MPLEALKTLRPESIPEKISYGYVACALTLSAFNSFFSGDAYFFLNSLLIGAGFFAVGYVLFYFGQWGGGDVKLAAGIGCTLGYLSHAGFFHDGLFPYYATYYINMICVALPYATVYGLYLGLKSPETWKEFGRYLRDKRTIVTFLLSFTPSFAAMYLNLYSLALFYTALPLMALIALYLKAVEIKALREETDVARLKVGDVPAEDLEIEGKILARKKDIEGISQEDISKLQKLAAEGKIPQD